MFNFHEREYIFKKSTGQVWHIFCDANQNICYKELQKNNCWSNSTILWEGAEQGFSADLDRYDRLHVLLQDNHGNIHYLRISEHATERFPVLNSKTPAAFNKHLYIAPCEENIHFFYVIPHKNSFILACQTQYKNNTGNPRVVDYVSGSSFPCAILYDKYSNLYAFYQVHDGTYFQLGYKKLTAVQNQWNDFVPITKYAGNCEYPRVIIDEDDIIHLCYQRRGPKSFEMVYQRKFPDMSLWSEETVVHASVYSFENASIVRVNEDIVIYWVREGVIYHNSGSRAKDGWGKPARFNFSAGRNLFCCGIKSNSLWDQPGSGKANLPSVSSALFRQNDIIHLPADFYPATLAGGLKLAFCTVGNIGNTRSAWPDGSLGTGNAKTANSKKEADNILYETMEQLWAGIEEIRELCGILKNDFAALANEYGEMTKVFGKYSIRLNMLENRIEQITDPDLSACYNIKSIEKAHPGVALQYNATEFPAESVPLVTDLLENDLSITDAEQFIEGTNQEEGIQVKQKEDQI